MWKAVVKLKTRAVLLNFFTAKTFQALAENTRFLELSDSETNKLFEDSVLNNTKCTTKYGMKLFYGDQNDKNFYSFKYSQYKKATLDAKR